MPSELVDFGGSGRRRVPRRSFGAEHASFRDKASKRAESREIERPRLRR